MSFFIYLFLCGKRNWLSFAPKEVKYFLFHGFLEPHKKHARTACFLCFTFVLSFILYSNACTNTWRWKVQAFTNTFSSGTYRINDGFWYLMHQEAGRFSNIIVTWAIIWLSFSIWLLHKSAYEVRLAFSSYALFSFFFSSLNYFSYWQANSTSMAFAVSIMRQNKSTTYTMWHIAVLSLAGFHVLPELF